MRVETIAAARAVIGNRDVGGLDAGGLGAAHDDGAQVERRGTGGRGQAERGEDLGPYLVALTADRRTEVHEEPGGSRARAALELGQAGLQHTRRGAAPAGVEQRD